jgi:hypothetical protein
MLEPRHAELIFHDHPRQQWPGASNASPRLGAETPERRPHRFEWCRLSQGGFAVAACIEQVCHAAHISAEADGWQATGS